MIHVGEITDLEYKCFKSLRKHNDKCVIYLYTFKNELKGIDRLDGFNIIFKELNHSTWDNRKMTNKIENIQNIIDDPQMSSDGDFIMVLDSDLYFQDNPFKLFTEFNDGDVFITSRGYPYRWSINAGVWGFINNKISRKFIKYYINQIHNPTWDKLVEFRTLARRDNNPDWWVDQDFLCVINDKGLPKELSNLKVIDIGHKYNYCPATDRVGYPQAAAMLKKAIGDSEYKILHLKGGLKLEASNIKNLQ